VHHFYDWFGLNVTLFHAINRLHAPWWDQLMLAMTWLGDYQLYPAYIAIALLVTHVAPRWLPRRNVVVFAVGYALTGLAVSTLKPLLAFPRPPLALGAHAVIVLGEPTLHGSFPSGHATFAVLFAASFAAGLSRPSRWLLWLFAALVCISRMSVGAHFPADVVGGALIGLAGAGVATLLVRGLSPRTT
jgi:undecaprenyl-diphosphatase